jgi:hypothetical protein
LYHDYNHQVSINLKNELAKGDHVLEMASLFPLNPKYEKLKSYNTLFNNDGLLSVFIFCAVVFIFSSLFFSIVFFRNRKNTNNSNTNYSKVKLVLVAVDMILLYYVVTLVGNERIFFFPVRFMVSYIPFLILLLIIPMLSWNFKVYNQRSWTKFSTFLFALNNLSYLTLLVLFFYWLSYRIF